MATAVGSVGLGATLAGGILSAKAATFEGAATQQMYNYQANVAKINSQLNKQNAEWAIERGEKESQIAGMKAGQRMGQIKVAQAASGIDIGSGTAADVRKSQKRIDDMDILQIRENAGRTAYDYNVKAQADLDQAGMYTSAGENAVKAAKLKSLASIIGTASSVSSKWMQGSQMGLWGGKSSGSGGSPFDITGSLY